MDTSNKDQFKKLTVEEKDKIIQELVLHPEEILCKSANDLFGAKPLAFKTKNRLFIDFATKEPALKIGEEIISQFLYNRQNLYIFKCDFVRDVQSPVLLLNYDFYMIQRRENYRLKFPSTLSSKVIVKNTHSTMIGRVSDLSTTGVRVGTADQAETLVVGTEFSMEIQVIGHEPLRLTAQLRHRTESTEIIKDKKTPYFYFGFQFVNLTSGNEKSLSRINMDLYRTFLQKVTN